MRKLDVDRDRVFSELSKRGSFSAIPFYNEIDFTFFEIESSFRMLSTVVFVFGFGAASFGFTYLIKDMIPPEAKLPLQLALLFVIFSLEEPVGRIVLARILPGKWSEAIRRWRVGGNIDDSQLQARGADEIRPLDWRFDLVMTRLGYGPRHTDQQHDFQMEQDVLPSIDYPWVFFRYWLSRRPVGALLFGISAFCAIVGWTTLFWTIVLPTYAVAAVLATVLTWGFIRCTYSELMSANLVLLVMQAEATQHAGLNLPSALLCRRLMQAVETRNENATRVFTHQFLADVLGTIDGYRRRIVVKSIIAPVLEKHFHNRLPQILRDAIDSFEAAAD